MTSTSRIELVSVTPTDLLGRLFSELDLSGVEYAVTRNYEQLPYSVGARDLDIVVVPAHRPKAVQVVARMAKEFGYLFAKCYADEKLAQLVLTKRTSAGLAELQIDFITSCQIYGVEFLSAAEMLKDLRSHNGIPVVSQPVVLLDKLLFHLAVGKPLHPKYDLMFAGIAGRNRTALLDKLIPLVGDKDGRHMVNEIRAGRASALPPLSAMQWLRMLVSGWRTQRAGAYSLLPKFIFYRLYDRVRPSGFWLSVSGPDGAGKTTVIELVLADLARAFGRDSLAHRGHFRPSVLPRLAELAKATGAVQAVDADYARPHRSVPSGVFGSLFRLSYYVADYIHGYFRLVRPALIDRQVVMFDRYYHDVIADPRRSRIGLPVWLLRAFALLVPLPSYSFFISVRPEIGHARKQELTLGQIEQLNLAYSDLVRQGFMTEVPNNGLAAEAAAAIVDHIFADRDRVARAKMKVSSR